MPQVAIIPSTFGYHWEEVYAAYKAYKDAGWEIQFYTVEGKPAVVDPHSILYRPLLSFIGLGVRKTTSPETAIGKELLFLLENKIQPIENLHINSIEAIYIPGGHGCMFDVTQNKLLHSKIEEAFVQGKILSAICHGSSLFAFVSLNGNSIIKGKVIIGFIDIFDSILLKMDLIHSKFLPMPYRNQDVIKKAGGILSVKETILSYLDPSYCYVDLPFITGVAVSTAKKVIQHFETTNPK
jgi:putative intracellular protease/amidase